MNTIEKNKQELLVELQNVSGFDGSCGVTLVVPFPFLPRNSGRWRDLRMVLLWRQGQYWRHSNPLFALRGIGDAKTSCLCPFHLLAPTCASISHLAKVSLPNLFRGMTYPFCGALNPFFWTSGDVCPGFQIRQNLFYPLTFSKHWWGSNRCHSV